MPWALFEHFLKMADNQQKFSQKYMLCQHVFVELSLFRILWMLDIDIVHVSMIEISVVP